MADALPRLRMDLDFMPSPAEDRPGLLIRDPFNYSDAVLAVPPVLVEGLQFFDGQHTELDLREALVRITGAIDVSAIVGHLRDTLSTAGFLHDKRYGELKQAAHDAFAAAPVRSPNYAGSAYPEKADELRATLTRYFAECGATAASTDGLVGIAAPHVSPDGGWQSYAAAYSALAPQDAGRVFVILGTSHYGAPEKFGLTRKPFATPFGEATTAVDLVDRLAAEAGDAVTMEDYCHAVEHSIEFQVVFLQHVYGPGIRILPILCGAYAHSIYGGGRPEEDEPVGRFLSSLRRLYQEERDRLFFVLGIDMAHMGRRYGDGFTATAGEGTMAGVAARDRERLDSILRGDVAGFWRLVQANRDDLKWCGASPLYTFLSAVAAPKGNLLRYQQWNIDPQSVVTFGALTFCGS